ncbi:reverse transcriptase domain-containing protein [Tanacetum coccineum]|uniref:Reverse transcriptase domain-containing protein n=1 Tax=Tanacetum coccineum TaxID=301880 RepID=A0ABQ5HZJ4_9ASTR
MKGKSSVVEDDDLSQPCTEKWKDGPAQHGWSHVYFYLTTGNARVWFDDLPPESIDSYNDLREAFLKNYLQQKKCIRDPIVLHNIKQREGESTEILSYIGAQIKERKKAPQAWRHPEGNHRQNFKKGGGFRSQHKPEEKIHSDRFAVLTKLQRILLALEKKENKTPPPMTTPVEKRNANKFCEFHGEVGHNTDECNQLKKQIKDMLKAGKLSHIIRELKQNTRKEPRKGMVRPPEKRSLRQF